MHRQFLDQKKGTTYKTKQKQHCSTSSSTYMDSNPTAVHQNIQFHEESPDNFQQVACFCTVTTSALPIHSEPNSVDIATIFDPLCGYFSCHNQEYEKYIREKPSTHCVSCHRFLFKIKYTK